MKGYSIGGYLNAVLRRSQRTVLVEGVSDRSVLQRLKSQRAKAEKRDLPGLIDIAEIVEDPEIFGLGKKSVVHAVLAKISSSSAARDRLIEKFGTLTDREWDGLQLDLEADVAWHAPSQNCPNFVTVGHSVENYFFRLEPIEAFLRQFFSDELNQGFFNELTTRFHSIIGFSVVYSLAIARIGAIRKADRLVSREFLEWQDGLYVAKAEINEALSARKANSSENFYLLANYWAQIYASRFANTEPGHWLCHGHLGEQAIWACVANLVRECGVSDDVANQVERGLNDVRFRHFVDYLCRDSSHAHAPLDATVDWLTVQAS